MCAAITASFSQMDYKSPRKLKMVSQTMSDQLEEESRRMDERLQILRKMMSAEKARREVYGDLRWHSGQKCPPPPQQSQPRKIRQTNKKPLRVRILTEKNSGVSGLSQAPHCGQCEKSIASLCCIECVENYCMVCFAKIHQKGALSRHHVKPMTQKASKTGMKPAHEDSSTNTTQPEAGSNTTTAAEVQARVETAPQHSITTSQFSLNDNQSSSQLPTGSLLEGTYDEAASAASFQQALAQWRGGGGVRDKAENTVACKDSSCNTKASASTQSVLVGSTQTDQPTTILMPHTDFKVQFSDKETGVSYFERLMMRRHRIDPVFLAKMSKTKSAGHKNQENLGESSQLDTNISDESDHQLQVESCPSQYNIFYAGEEDEGNIELPLEDAGMSCSYKQGDCEVLEPFERPLSSVRIEEMHNDCAVPSASTYTCTTYNIENAILDSKDSAPPQGKSRKDRTLNTNKPHSAKSSKVKASKEPSRTRSKKPQRGRTKQPAAPSHGDARHLKVIEPAVAASVKNAWGRSTQAENTSNQLTGFFLSGVQQSTQEAHHQLPVQDRLLEPSGMDNRQFEFASTIWLPGNSIIPDPSIQSESTTSRDATSFDPSEACSDTRAIDFTTDLPPPSGLYHLPQLGTSSDTLTPTPSYYDSITSSDGESEDQDEPSVLDVEFEMEGRQGLELQQQENEEDDEALKTLAWELASVTGGRLTRCDREEEEEEEEDEGVESFGREEGGELVEGSYFGSGADLQQVMSDFELYQQQIMEQESD